MPLQNHRELDPTGWKLLRLLQENARMSFRQIGELIGMTAPAVGERIHRLEDAGIVKNYHAEIDLTKVGRPITAFVHLVANSHDTVRFHRDVVNIPEVIECYSVTGIEACIMKVAVTSVPHLEQLLMMLKEYGDLRTSLILSTQVAGRVIDEPPVIGES